MKRTAPGRAVVVLAVGAGLSLQAQLPTQLPASKPSAARLMDSPPPSTANPATQAVVTFRALHRPEVTFTHNELTVHAENASLNQILREIGRLTGIKITGGVAEERVFGNYGPSTAAEVLNTLLVGTGSNVLLLAPDATSPGELILTARNGGVTPPNPNAPGFDDEGADDTQVQPQMRRGVTLFGPPPGADPQPQLPPQQPVQPALYPAGVDPGNPTNSVSPQSPNGVKSPLEIFQQLQQLRQQQQQQQNATPPPN